MIRDHSANVSFEAVTTCSFEKRREEILKDLQKSYDEAYKAWAAAKKEAEAGGKTFNQKPPAEPSVKSIKTVTGKKEADAEVTRLRKEAEAGRKPAD